MFIEVGIPLLAAMLLDINSLIIAGMLIAFVVHEATAMWDGKLRDDGADGDAVRIACSQLPGMIPLMGIIIVASLHWGTVSPTLRIGNRASAI